MSMNPIPPSLSVAGHVYQRNTDFLNDYSSQPERVMKQISVGFAYTGIMIFATLETIAHGINLLALKGFCHFIQDTEANKRAFAKKYIKPAGESFLFSTAIIGSAGISLKDNFAKCSFKESVNGQIINGNETIGKVSTFILETFSNQLRAMGFSV